MRQPKATSRSPLRAVLDTNVFVAAFLARRPESPTRELLNRWRQNEFELLYSDDLLVEIVEKLHQKGFSERLIASFVVEFRDGATFVGVSPNAVRAVIAADPDDDLVLACAVAGKATHLVTYDPHFAVLGGEYEGVAIVDALTFLHVLRQSVH